MLWHAWPTLQEVARAFIVNSQAYLQRAPYLATGLTSGCSRQANNVREGGIRLWIHHAGRCEAEADGPFQGDQCNCTETSTKESVDGPDDRTLPTDPEEPEKPEEKPEEQIGASCSKLWEQCGGNNWDGHTSCAVGSTCEYSNPGYSHCKPSPDEPGTVAKWGQCGGNAYKGPTTCTAGSICVYGNPAILSVSPTPTPRAQEKNHRSFVQQI